MDPLATIFVKPPIVGHSTYPVVQLSPMSKIFSGLPNLLKSLPIQNPNSKIKTLRPISSTMAAETQTFNLSPTSKLKIQKGDITRWSINASSDAIVNAANERMVGGGGVDGAIHRAAGPDLRKACSDVPEVRPGVRCPTGEARITKAFRLLVSRVIHTVGPIYRAVDRPQILLGNAYRNCLTLAKLNNIQYIAFPAISCGVFGYPFNEAATVAISAIKEFADDFKEVHFVLFEDDIYDIWVEKAKELL